jgi:hypothetical protein
MHAEFGKRLSRSANTSLSPFRPPRGGGRDAHAATLRAALTPLIVGLLQAKAQHPLGISFATAFAIHLMSRLERFWLEEVVRAKSSEVKE